MKIKWLTCLIVSFIFLSCNFIGGDLDFPSYVDKTSDNSNSTKDDILAPEINIEHEERKWSILVYMAADNNLESEAIADLLEMEKSKLVTDEVTVLVLLDRNEGYNTSNGNWSSTKMLKLKTGRSDSQLKIISEEISCPELNLSPDKEIELDMSSNYVLEGAIDFMKKRFPSQYYGLIMWGHGTGWRNNFEETAFHKGYCYDDSSNSYMSLYQFSQGLKNCLGSSKLDFIGFDTCFGAELENVYELKDYCRYMVGSEGLTLASGWNYELLFNNLDDLEEVTPSLLCEEIIFAFEEEYKKKNSAVISMIDMEYAQNFFDSFENYMEELCSLINSVQIRDGIMDLISHKILSYTYGSSGSDVYLDVNSLINETYNYLSLNYTSELIAELSIRKEEFQKSLDTALCSSWSSMEDNACLGVFFAELAEGGLFACSHPFNYIKDNSLNQIKFVEDSNWYVPSKDSKGSFLDKIFYIQNF